MSRSDAGAASRSDLARLDVTAGDEATEIFVIDHAFHRVAAGRGRLVARVAPGLYKVRFRTGSALHDTLVEARPRDTVAVQADPLMFPASPPLTLTSTTRDVHEAAARTVSRTTHVRAGDGAQLFVFVRDPDAHAPPFDPSCVELRTAAGHPIGSPALAGRVDDARGWAALACDVAPGAYRLRLHGDGAPLDVRVVACRGWQSQCFVTVAASAERTARRARVPDPASLSVLLHPVGHGFDPAAEENRLAELARIGLWQGRMPLTDARLAALLDADAAAPMLALYGALLLLPSRARASRVLCERLIAHLARAIPDHPDVTVLQGRATGAASARMSSISSPPTLWRSWELLVRDARRRPRALGDDHPVLRVGAHAVPAGVWFATRVGAAAPRRADASPPSGRPISERRLAVDRVGALLGLGAEALRALAHTPDAERFAPVERYVLDSALAALAGGALSTRVRARQIVACAQLPARLVGEAAVRLQQAALSAT